MKDKFSWIVCIQHKSTGENVSKIQVNANRLEIVDGALVFHNEDYIVHVCSRDSWSYVTIMNQTMGSENGWKLLRVAMN